MSSWSPEEERTRPSGRIPHASAPSLPPEEPVTIEAMVGKVMRDTVKQTLKIRELELTVSRMDRELGQIRKELELDRTHLVASSSKKAAGHASNRMAALVTGLFALWEVASPYLHELAKWLHK
jgi:hypothetical protein